MIKNVFIAAMLLLICFAPKAWAYDFSAVCESGQTLYYNITSSTQPYTVEVASNEAAKGDLVIPSTVSNDGKKYSVTGIGMRAFYKCKELKSVIMPNSIASIGDSAFYRCEGLTSVKIPKSVNSIGNGAFSYCDKFTDIIFESDITLSEADLYFVKKGIKYTVMDKKTVKVMPNKIIRMETILMPDPNSEDPDNPDYIEVEEEEEDYSCLEDSIVVIPETLTVGNTFTVTSIGGIAGYCAHVKSVTIPNTVTSIGNYAFSFETLESINIPNSVTSIGDGAFSYSGITSISIPNSVTSIGKHAFEVSSLASITIPNSVTSIGDTAFSSCINLKSVSLPSSLKNIGKNVFMWSDSIADITLNCDIDVSDADLHIIKDGIKYVVQDKKSVKIMSDYGYEERKVLDPYSDPDNPDYYLEVVLEKRCPKNPIITIPETINAGDTFTVTSIDSEAFEGCGELTSVTIPNSVTEIGDYAFLEVKNVTYSGTAAGSPWGAQIVNGYVDGDLLYSDETKTNLVGCSKYATDVIIPNTVTSIDDYAFYNCWNLKSITLPSSVTSIGDGAFRGCYKLDSKTVKKISKINPNAFKME